MASDDMWILGINMTKFGKHPDKDVVDLAAEAALAALADGGVSMKEMGVLAAGNLMGAAAGVGQQLQKQIGQTGIPFSMWQTHVPLVQLHCVPSSWRFALANAIWA